MGGVGEVVVWQPNPPLPGRRASSQSLFLSCPAYEALLEGPRGSGKTSVLLVDFAQEVGKGFGPYWRGVLFRETYPQLEDVKHKSQVLFREAFPEAVWNASEYHWTWPDGERLFFRHMKSPEDYWNYHGHEYPWIGWEELTNWATLECYDRMKACCRSSYPGIPKRIRSTCNPWGKGHGAVKGRFIDPAPSGRPVVDPKTSLARVRIHCPLEENRPLLEADTSYADNLESIEDENLRRAWRYGDWDIAAGAFFADVWEPKRHVLEPFQVPASWRVTRAFDWGSARPFSIGWYAESDGSQVGGRTFPRGTLFRVAEWYGWNGKANEGTRQLASDIARGVLERERAMVGGLLAPGCRITPGPADTSIYDVENGRSIAADMASAGVAWGRANKAPGSRRHGWERARKLLSAARKHPLEEPGFFVFSTCRQWIRTVPVLVRSDKDPDDIDTSQEDHAADEWRYKLLDGVDYAELTSAIKQARDAFRGAHPRTGRATP